MAKINIFNDFIIIGHLQDKELDNRIIEVLQNSKKEKDCRVISNVGGFQTNDIKDEFIRKKLFLKIQNLLIENMSFKKGKIEISLLNLWINENNKRDYNIAHIHPHSDISGVYYTKTFPKGGELVFSRDNKGLENSNLYNVFASSNFDLMYKIKPEDEMIILFPSYLTHSVNPTNEDGRISTSFNLEVINHG